MESINKGLLFTPGIQNQQPQFYNPQQQIQQQQQNIPLVSGGGLLQNGIQQQQNQILQQQILHPNSQAQQQPQQQQLLSINSNQNLWNLLQIDQLSKQNSLDLQKQQQSIQSQLQQPQQPQQQELVNQDQQYQIYLPDPNEKLQSLFPTDQYGNIQIIYLRKTYTLQKQLLRENSLYLRNITNPEFQLSKLEISPNSNLDAQMLEKVLSLFYGHKINIQNGQDMEKFEQIIKFLQVQNIVKKPVQQLQSNDVQVNQQLIQQQQQKANFPILSNNNNNIIPKSNGLITPNTNSNIYSNVVHKKETQHQAQVQQLQNPQQSAGKKKIEKKQKQNLNSSNEFVQSIMNQQNECVTFSDMEKNKSEEQQKPKNRKERRAQKQLEYEQQQQLLKQQQQQQNESDDIQEWEEPNQEQQQQQRNRRGRRERNQQQQPSSGQEDVQENETVVQRRNRVQKKGQRNQIHSSEQEEQQNEANNESNIGGRRNKQQNNKIQQQQVHKQQEDKNKKQVELPTFEQIAQRLKLKDSSEVKKVYDMIEVQLDKDIELQCQYDGQQSDFDFSDVGKLLKKHKQPKIFLFQTQNEKIFGLYINGKFKSGSVQLNQQNCFMFSLDPWRKYSVNQQKLDEKNGNIELLYCQNFLILGDNDLILQDKCNINENCCSLPGTFVCENLEEGIEQSEGLTGEKNFFIREMFVFLVNTK